MQVTAKVVADDTVVVPQVPLAGDKVTTAPVAKPVPAMANDVVVAAVPVAGVTPVIVGPAPMSNGSVMALVELVPPSGLVTV